MLRNDIMMSCRIRQLSTLLIWISREKSDFQKNTIGRLGLNRGGIKLYIQLKTVMLKLLPVEGKNIRKIEFTIAYLGMHIEIPSETKAPILSI